jgi:hypothetical protein
MPEPESGSLPHDESIEFRDSSYFKSHSTLPSPAEVRELASRSTDARAINPSRPPPVKFADRDLIVKYGTEITPAEGQCLIFVRRSLYPQVPVPGVYGWTKDAGQTFIYMELVDGVTLEERWDTLVEHERLSVCEQLRSMINLWRALPQDSPEPFIGKPRFLLSCPETTI